MKILVGWVLNAVSLFVLAAVLGLEIPRLYGSEVLALLGTAVLYNLTGVATLLAGAGAGLLLAFLVGDAARGWGSTVAVLIPLVAMLLLPWVMANWVAPQFDWIPAFGYWSYLGASLFNMFVFLVNPDENG